MIEQKPETSRTLFYLESGKHHLYSAYYYNSADVPSVLLLPPLFEERKCSLRLLGELASQLSSIANVLRIDFSGTGESSGLFVKSRFQYWRQDIDDAVNFLKKRSTGPVYILGARLGANLALSSCSTEGLILLDPIKDGAAFLGDLLRRKQIKEMMAKGKATTDSERLLKDWENGAVVDLDAYEVNAELYKDLKSINLSEDLSHHDGNLLLVHSSAAREAPSDWLNLVDESKSGRSFIYFRQKPFWGMLDYEPYSELRQSVYDYLIEERD